MRRTEAKSREPAAAQIDLFADFNGLPSDRSQDRVLPARRQLVEPHDPRRQPAGDGVASPSARGCAGKVQCIYIDPPYGIKFNSNFQWSTTSRDVKDGNNEPHHARAGAGEGVPRHVARWNSFLSDVSAGSTDRRAGSAARSRVRSSFRSATRMFIASGADG